MPEVNFPDRPAYEPIFITPEQSTAWRTNSPETVIGDPRCAPEIEPRFSDLWEDEGI